MRIAAFDLGAKCGYAILDHDSNIISSGTWKLGKRSGKSIYLFHENLLWLFSCSVDVVGYEKVHGRHASKAAAHAYGGYEAVLWMTCYESCIDRLELVTVQQIKQEATGSARADKEDMEDAAFDRWGIIVSHDDEADALWCAEVTRRRVLNV